MSDPMQEHQDAAFDRAVKEAQAKARERVRYDEIPVEDIQVMEGWTLVHLEKLTELTLPAGVEAGAKLVVDHTTDERLQPGDRVFIVGNKIGFPGVKGYTAEEIFMVENESIVAFTRDAEEAS